MDTLDIFKAFSQLGLAQEEIDICVALMRNSGMNMTDLSKSTRIPRSSLYRYVDELIHRDLVSWQQTVQGKRLFLADLRSLNNRIEDEIKGLKRQQLMVEQLAAAVNMVGNTDRPAFRSFDGREKVKQLLWNSLGATSPELRVMASAFRRELFGSKWLLDYNQEFIRKQLSERIIANSDYEQTLNRNYGERREYYSPLQAYVQNSQLQIKLKSILEFTGEIIIYDNVIATYSVGDDDVTTGYEVESPTLANSLANMFDLLWTK